MELPVVFGGWNYRTERFCRQISERKNSEAFLSFLGDLLAQRPRGRRLVLVMDNAGYHRAKKVRGFLAEHGERLEPFWLPPYSPELNLIEYAWGYLKETRQLNSSPDSPIQLHFKSLENLHKAA